MMTGAAAGLGIGYIVEGDHDAINGDVVLFGVLLQLLDTLFRPHLVQGLVCFQIVADSEAQGPQLTKPVRLEWEFFKAFQYAESHEGHTTLPTGFGIQQPDGAGCQIAPVLIMTLRYCLQGYPAKQQSHWGG